MHNISTSFSAWFSSQGF